MKISDLESLWRNLRQKPFRTLLFLSVAVAIAIAGIWAAAYFGELGTQHAEQPQPPAKVAALEIADLSVANPRSPHPVIDLKLMNTGDGVAFLTEISAEVLGKIPYAGLVEPSAEYDLLIDGDVNTIPVSHNIKPNDVERILLKLGAARHNLSCEIELQLRLKYNGDAELLSQPFEVAFFEDHEGGFNPFAAD